ncbi:hypothetical protein AB0G79_03365 [Streptomyces sp. NPDC020807]|uniref:hypothetical protein n=1 Tax=Streptomyces sp. NPDC020807 TaxID=3155119 RepID=UPI0033DA6875
MIATWVRHALLAAAVLPLVPALAGCGVPPAGFTGVSVTVDGKPLGVVLVCHDRIDEVLLYPTPPEPEAGADAAQPEYTDAWYAAEPVGGFATWPLTDPAGGNGWTPDTAPHDLKQNQRYTVYGATEDNSWSTLHHSFTLADLEKLTPDQVSYTREDKVRTTTVAEFRAHACEGF